MYLHAYWKNVAVQGIIFLDESRLQIQAALRGSGCRFLIDYEITECGNVYELTQLFGPVVTMKLVRLQSVMLLELLLLLRRIWNAFQVVSICFLQFIRAQSCTDPYFSFSPRCVMRVRGVACAFHASSEKYVTGARLLAVEMHYGLRRFWRGGDIRQ